MNPPEVVGGIAAVLFADWFIRALFWPFGPCRWCKGRRGRNAGSSAKRWGKCWRCGASGERQVLGSKAVHRAVQAARPFRNRRKP